MAVRRRSGIALVNVLIFTFLTTMFLVVGIQFTQGAIKQGRSAGSESQVYNVALAGINHAVFWLQKQDPSIPLTAFDPIGQNPTEPDEDPETEEEQLGLVHEFEIDPSRRLWGRYEVARSSNAPARDGLTVGASSPLYTDPITWTVEDVSLARGSDSPGQIWRVRARAYIFERPSDSVSFSLTGTKPLEVAMLEGEVGKGSFEYRTAAVYSFLPGSTSGSELMRISTDPNSGDTTRVQILDGTAYHYWMNVRESDSYFENTVRYMTGGSDTSRNGIENASDPDSPLYVDTDLAEQLDYFFGVRTVDEVKALATHIYEDAADVPSPQPPMGFLYVKPESGSITFKNGGSEPTLNGSGILFVDGDLELDGNDTAQTWSGLIFVTGEYKQRKSSTVTGAVVCGGKCFIEGSNDKRSHVIYSRAELDRVMERLGSFRLNRATLRLVDESSPGPTTY